tara:strand:+ start:1196 stop:2014 length:819 start_codon:yes stop_codon:yes gene_type:complete
MKLKEYFPSFLQSFRLNRPDKGYFFENKNILDVIVSLTAIESRLDNLHLVLKSIWDNPDIPKSIVLNLHLRFENKLPHTLSELQGTHFEIHYTELDCPHAKLIPSLKRFPNDCIISCDDDLLYQKNWLKLLYETHLKHPKAIITNQSRIISFDNAQNILPYTQWRTSYNPSIQSEALLPIGSSGTLYPQASLNHEVLNEELFLKLCPKADDLWFKMMSYLNQTESILAENRPKPALPIIGSQQISLSSTNIKEDQNRVQWLALSKHFKVNRL